jgi:hypothetical protein
MILKYIPDASGCLRGTPLTEQEAVTSEDAVTSLSERLVLPVLIALPFSDT